MHTPAESFGQLAFFIDYLKQAGLFDGWVADCPLRFTSPNAPRKRDLLGDAKVLVWRQSEAWRVPGAPGIPGWATFRCTTSVVVRRGLVSSFDLRGNGCAG